MLKNKEEHLNVHRHDIVDEVIGIRLQRTVRNQGDKGFSLLMFAGTD